MATVPPPEDTALSLGRRSYALTVLFLINFMNFYDRQVVGAVGEKIKQEWLLTDGQLAGLTTAFILVYAVVGIPLGRIADRGSRQVMLTGGITVWSAFTALSGAAGSFASHFLARMGVGVGEASLAPTANSLIGDLFPPHQRARALSIFMLGLPFGTAASYLISGAIAQATGGWRPALYAAAAPGFVLAIFAYFIVIPARPSLARADETTVVSTVSSIATILRIRPMWWIIASGALLNLALYALSVFSTSFYIRYHGLSIADATRYNAVVTLVGGGVGMLFGGWLGDRFGRRGPSARLLVAMGGVLLAIPFFWLALDADRGDGLRSAACLGVAVLFTYCYYSSVYAAIHDLVPATLRGTAMSVYFLVFYLFTALGLVIFGALSDAMAARALAAGVTAAESRAVGLHDAMYAIPLSGVLLVLVLFAASRSARTVQR